MKSLFLTFALLLTGASVFAANDIVNPATEGNAIVSVVDLSIVDVSIIDDEICYSATISAGAQIGPLEVGGSIQVSGCGETAAEAWSNFLAAMNLSREE